MSEGPEFNHSHIFMDMNTLARSLLGVYVLKLKNTGVNLIRVLNSRFLMDVPVHVQGPVQVHSSCGQLAPEAISLKVFLMQILSRCPQNLGVPKPS